MLKKPELTPKKIALEYARRTWDEKDLGAIDDLVDNEVVIHSLLGDFHGKNALKEVVQAWLMGFPDLQVSNHIISESFKWLMWVNFLDLFLALREPKAWGAFII